MYMPVLADSDAPTPHDTYAFLLPQFDNPTNAAADKRLVQALHSGVLMCLMGDGSVPGSRLGRDPADVGERVEDRGREPAERGFLRFLVPSRDRPGAARELSIP